MFDPKTQATWRGGSSIDKRGYPLHDGKASIVRERGAVEVDFLVPAKSGTVQLVEAKWSKTVTPEFARAIGRLGSAMGKRPWEAVVVHRAAKTGQRIEALAPGVKAKSVEEFLSGLP